MEHIYFWVPTLLQVIMIIELRLIRENTKNKY
jgi:hypothetical protein